LRARPKASKERRLALVMSKWIVITEVKSEVDPAIFKYVNGTTLISSHLKEEAPSSPICGECIAPLIECAHSYILRQEKK
jgi:hypothetical protein